MTLMEKWWLPGISTHSSRAALQLTDSILIRFPELNTEQNPLALQSPPRRTLKLVSYSAWEWQRGHSVKDFLIFRIYHQAKLPSSIQSCVGGTKQDNILNM